MGYPKGHTKGQMTEHNHAVARLLLKGLTNDQIAERLGRSNRAVQGQVRRLCEMHGVETRYQLMLKLVEV